MEPLETKAEAPEPLLSEALELARNAYHANFEGGLLLPYETACEFRSVRSTQARNAYRLLRR